ncbi:MAG TPA: hypothetical protein VI078_02190 [bacterium]
MREAAAARRGPARATFLAAWGGMLAATLALAGIGSLATPAGLGAGPAGGASALPAGIALFAVLCAIAVPLLARVLLAPERIAPRLPAPDAALVRRYLLVGHLALWSLAALPALLGLAQLFLGGSPATHYALCALSLVGLAWLMPTARRVGGR